MTTVQGVATNGLRRLRRVPAEAVFWTAALLAVASINPEAEGLVNLCLFEALGIPCPGDGLGRAIAFLVRGQWAASWAAHPLAVPVVAGLGYHIVSLCRTPAGADSAGRPRGPRNPT